MKVADVMTREVVCCRPEDSLDRAAQVMWERDCGCVPVVDEGGRALGMVTDRDLTMAAYTTGRPLSSLQVATTMARPVRSCQATDGLDDALDVLAREQLHRLPVVDRDGRLVGIVSLADAIQATRAASPRPRKKLGESILETLADVTAPRRASAPAEDKAPPRRASAKGILPAAPRKRRSPSKA